MANETLDDNMVEMRGSISGLVENFLNNCSAAAEPVWSPEVDVRETAGEFLVRAALPGVRKEDVETEIKENLLSITGKRVEQAAEGDTWLRREIPAGRFCRVFKIGARFKSEDIRAILKDGLLEIRIPKADGEKPNRIQID
ncbi:MAG: Hsp20/alpha crystallin family protein [Elusimicrobiaceae bacterium]|nr:Hsp20/alpha crystallin family protein [Elusimicrobiaceae bacterium]